MQTLVSCVMCIHTWFMCIYIYICICRNCVSCEYGPNNLTMGNGGMGRIPPGPQMVVLPTAYIYIYIYCLWLSMVYKWYIWYLYCVWYIWCALLRTANSRAASASPSTAGKPHCNLLSDVLLQIGRYVRGTVCMHHKASSKLAYIYIYLAYIYIYIYIHT